MSGKICLWFSWPACSGPTGVCDGDRSTGESEGLATVDVMDVADTRDGSFGTGEELSRSRASVFPKPPSKLLVPLVEPG